MTKENYQPSGSTPLYDNTIMLLGSVIAEVQKAKNDNRFARAGILIVSDGKDEGSSYTAEDARKIVQDMIKSEDRHTIAFMGIRYENVDFYAIANSMGIYDVDIHNPNPQKRIKRIITPESDPKAIRRAFNLVSRTMLVPGSDAIGGGFSSQGRDL